MTPTQARLLANIDGLFSERGGTENRYMPVTNEALKQDLDQLTLEQLQQVADFIAFLLSDITAG